MSDLKNNATALIVHTFDGHEIEERITDGYYNATAMCKSRGGRWNDWATNDSTKELIEAISRRTGIPVSELIQSLRGGEPAMQGTWVQRDVALALAMWLDADLHAAIIGWVLDGKPKSKFQIPDNLADALMLAGTIEKERQEALALIEKQRPHVEAQKRLETATGSIALRDAAKRLHLKLDDLSNYLLEWKLCYRDGSRRLRPYGKYTVKRDGMKTSTSGYFDMDGMQAVTEGGVLRDMTYMVITPKGLGIIARKLGIRLDDQPSLF